ncbi:hypothetical protein FT663_03754 [Candidozyma haemuli var. vulneris]|uniref:F-BAR domain-containing protein n=1 Tax=Candidozyma haemuli TaxID=45357 RepID=A0A2V1ARD7_9ASCO|nr:hypothetical protein CXQ85_002196 [[Candida] haemuloni]KAF3989083.1 hypothetical protein FT663_03754 [[Candida] haemuloni var. vulneris]KAF3991204.1 hypothetical protein FT662_01879 [[Candida] haemuloni var. vulneris]PVH20408.1 hypothetical protein CXQ85_002196 [[Candida] haemuloni]
MSADTAFVNRFWGQQEAGFQVIQTRLAHSLTTLQELLTFYKERVAIEKEYNKRLDKLVGSYTLGSGETGSIKVALEKLQIESSNMVKQNQKFIKSVAFHNHEKLNSFYNNYKSNVAKVEGHMQKVLAKKRDFFAHLDATKDRYRAECHSIKTLQLQCQTTWGKELEKNTSKLAKAEKNASVLKDQYLKSIHKCAEIHEIWVRDWRAALSNIYQLEIERIQICKLNCFNFCNHIASLCVDWDQSADVARTSFASILAPKDIHDFAEVYGTGNKISKAPQFIDFAEGYDEDSESMEYDLADFKDPDFSQILTRTFSTQSAPSSKQNSPTKATPKRRTGEAGSPSRGANGGMPTLLVPENKSLPPIREPNGDTQGELRKQLSQTSAYTSGPEDKHDDVFDSGKKFSASNGSDYSNPTNYTSQTARSWASPRKKERSEVQERINRRSQDWTNTFAAPSPQPQKPNVPITKDFSMDFIAKALEDLNTGGNGDVNQFRRSVRSQANPAAEKTNYMNHRPQSDFVDDSREQATRYDSISFKTPQKPRPKSMVDSVMGEDDSMRTVVEKTPVKPQSQQSKRFSSQSPTKSFMDLHSMIDKVTPVSRHEYVAKAKALYTYNAREEGELSFRKGWNMYVLHKQEDNWYVCELANNCGSDIGNVGLVPYNYVKEGDHLF